MRALWSTDAGGRPKWGSSLHRAVSAGMGEETATCGCLNQPMDLDLAKERGLLLPVQGPAGPAIIEEEDED